MSEFFDSFMKFLDEHPEEAIARAKEAKAKAQGTGISVDEYFARLSGDSNDIAKYDRNIVLPRGMVWKVVRIIYTHDPQLWTNIKKILRGEK